MNTKLFLLTIFAFSLLLCNCNNPDKDTNNNFAFTFLLGNWYNPDHYTEHFIRMEDYRLAAYSRKTDPETSTEYLVIFECGFGYDHTIWDFRNVVYDISRKSDVLFYDRAGYGKSESPSNARDIPTMCSDLHSVINEYRNSRKIILVGHSVGGFIIRDYAITYPLEIAALVFIDTSHEKSQDQMEQSEEDSIYESAKSIYGANSGAALEARELIEDFTYMATRPDLPNVPVIVLDSMKVEPGVTPEMLARKYDATDSLKAGVDDFTHITTKKSSHMIMIDEPDLVITIVKNLIGKLNDGG
jgi:hypothetical protein